ncbi:hypothetical protein K1719_004026 [Acacia pycnantha]|nr:hypothetical protein K1719_004026 [Acacia pycnantha]
MRRLSMEATASNPSHRRLHLTRCATRLAASCAQLSYCCLSSGLVLEAGSQLNCYSNWDAVSNLMELGTIHFKLSSSGMI